MSNKILNRIWEIGTAASSLSHLAVLTAVGDACNDDGYCWMSLETLERKVKKVKRRQLINLINDLAKAGDVAVIKTYVEDGRNTFNHYVVTVGMTAAEQERAIALAIRHTFGRGVVRHEAGAGATQAQVADPPLTLLTPDGGAIECTPIGGEGAAECTLEGVIECTGRVQPITPDPSSDPIKTFSHRATSAAPFGPEPEPPYEPEHPAELMRQMAAEASTPRLAPLAANEDEFHAATRAYETAARAARLARMSPDERRRVEATERMVEMLARVTETTVKANRGRLESVAAKVDEFTPEQIWRGFGDPQGWWFQEWYKGKKYGQKPTLYDVQEFAGRAVAWQPRPGGGDNVAPAQAESAWAAVKRAISSFGRYRQGELLASLDEVTRAAVKAVGLGRLMDVDLEDRYAANQVQRNFKQEYAEQARRLGAQMQAAD